MSSQFTRRRLPMYRVGCLMPFARSRRYAYSITNECLDSKVNFESTLETTCSQRTRRKRQNNYVVAIVGQARFRCSRMEKSVGIWICGERIHVHNSAIRRILNKRKSIPWARVSRRDRFISKQVQQQRSYDATGDSHWGVPNSLWWRFPRFSRFPTVSAAVSLSVILTEKQYPERYRETRELTCCYYRFRDHVEYRGILFGQLHSSQVAGARYSKPPVHNDCWFQCHCSNVHVQGPEPGSREAYPPI